MKWLCSAMAVAACLCLTFEVCAEVVPLSPAAAHSSAGKLQSGAAAVPVAGPRIGIGAPKAPAVAAPTTETPRPQVKLAVETATTPEAPPLPPTQPPADGAPRDGGEPRGGGFICDDAPVITFDQIYPGPYVDYGVLAPDNSACPGWDPAYKVWYKYTCTVAGEYVFTLCDSDPANQFDSVLVVRDGACPCNMSTWGWADADYLGLCPASPSSPTMRRDLPVAGHSVGHTYYILVGTPDAAPAPGHSYKLTVSCNPYGACYLPNGSCSITPQRSCSGQWAGPFTTCEYGACYIPSTGACSITTQLACQGVWAGPGTTCAYGGCCHMDGTCSLTTQWGCDGAHRGDATTCDTPCDPPGACHHPDGSCAITFEANCVGTWEGPYTVCPLGACCRPDASCTVTAPVDCSGVYLGNGTTCWPNNCPPPNVRCCLHDGAGTCAMIPIADCEAAGGTPSVYGSDCTTPIPDTYTVTIGSNPFEDISATGLPGPVATNYGVGMIVPLGFTFPFGGNYDRVWFNVNGFLDIGGTSSSGNFVYFPNPDSATLVAPRWYRRLNGGTINRLKYQTLGTPGVDRRFIAQWKELAGCWAGTDTFQVVLYESGCIEFRYAELDNSDIYGPCFSAGVRNTNVTELVASNTCIHLCPNPSGSGPYQCDTYGACCQRDGTCAFITPYACAVAGGSYRGDGVDCATGCPIGACCNSWYATCTETTEFACTLGGSGIFLGGGTACATSQCSSCAPCPEGGISENEPDCGMTVDENWGMPIDYVNGGCWTYWLDPSLPANFTSIECGQTICATSALDGLYYYVNDIDVYQVVLTQPTRLTFTVNSSFPILFGGVQQIVPGVPGCENATGSVTPWNGIDWPGCGTAAVTTGCLSPGTYYFVVWPFGQAIGWWMDCGAQYTATLTCDNTVCSACCHEYDTACVDGVTSVFCAGPHDSFHPGQICAEVTCETPPTWGACCHGLNGICEDNISQENCSGPNDTWHAGYLCADVGFACPCFACPAGGIPENEPNGGMPVDTVNGGCNAYPYLFTWIEPGQTICGTAFESLEAGMRDTDWFAITTTEPGAFVWTVTAQFDAVVGVVEQITPGEPSCNLTGYIYPGAMMGPCETARVVTDVMPAGTYFFIVVPQIEAATSWGSPYVATLSFPMVLGACCYADASCLERTSAECVAAAGTYQGDETSCSPSPCAPAVCRGDCNCDGQINWRDIDYFVAAMSGEAAWHDMFLPGIPTCSYSNNDVNEDGIVNWRDIDPFLAVMGESCP